MMTETLSKVVCEMADLSIAEQDELAEMIEQELHWKKAFVQSHDFLAQLADEALREHTAQKTKTITCE